MNHPLSENLLRFRRESRYTQKEIADYLHISFQTVSKWERGLGNPDIELLPKLADLYGTTTDVLLGHTLGELHRTVYCDLYKDESYYWGIEPTPFCYRVLQEEPPTRRLRLLEICCGEGRDAVFFARNGYDVTAYDIAEDGVRKAHKLAERFQTSVNAFCADINEFHPKESYHIVYASRALHYLNPQNRETFFEEYKERTCSGGIHAFMVLVDKPSIPPPPDSKDDIHMMKSGEIFTYYYDWDFSVFEEKIIDCHSSGIPHQHCVNFMIARKP